MKRCFWVDEKSDIYVKYHDEEWGVPKYDDRELFELLILEGFQAGLSWICVLKKREAFRKAFDNFDVETVARYDSKKVEELLKNEGIIRSRNKIESAIKNAKLYMEIQKELCSVSNYI
jgi:DNA-3-methyladenine glycosylase I